MTSGPVGAVVAAWLAVALVGSYELLMMVIRNSQAGPDAPSDTATMPDPLQEQAAEVFADHLAANRVPVGGTLRAGDSGTSRAFLALRASRISPRC